MKYLNHYLKQTQGNIFEKNGVFFAFNNKQFEEGVKKVGANKNNKVTKVDLGVNTGCYVLSRNYETFLKEFEKSYDEAIRLDMKENGCKKIIWRELENHEFQISNDIEPILNALELYPISIKEIGEQVKPYIKYCNENDLY